ncbi:MAG: LuxR C-terminal-related transcriptional regulator [Gaiella sp.]
MTAVLRSGDLAHALELVRRVNDATDPDDFAEAATAGLRELIACDFAAYSEINLRAGRTIVFTDPRDVKRVDADEAFARNVHEHPVAVYYATHNGGPALRMSDLISTRAFRRTALFDELFRPVSGNYLLTCPLPVPRGLVVGFALLRTRRDFTEGERALLDLMTPHLAHAYQDSFARSALEAAAGPGEAPLLVLDRSRALLYATPTATEILERVLSFTVDGSGALPTIIRDWMNGRAPQRLVVVANGRRLNVNALGTRPAALLLSDSPATPTATELRALGLTPREGQVLALLSEGLTNAGIAGALVISPRTVKKHLENVYGKLGVSTRAAAVSAALSAH